MSECVLEGFAAGDGVVVPITNEGRVGSPANTGAFSGQNGGPFAVPEPIALVWKSIEIHSGPVLRTLTGKTVLTKSEAEAVRNVIAMHLTRSAAMLPFCEALIDLGSLPRETRAVLGALNGEPGFEVVPPDDSLYPPPSAQLGSAVMNAMGAVHRQIEEAPVRLVLPRDPGATFLCGDRPAFLFGNQFFGFMPLGRRIGVFFGEDTGPAIYLDDDAVARLNRGSVDSRRAEVYSHPGDVERFADLYTKRLRTRTPGAKASLKPNR